MMSLQVTKASQTSQTMNRPQFHNSAFEGTMFKRPQAPRKAITAASAVPVQTLYFNYGILGPFWC